MSILIMGLEMPTNCFLCPLSVLRGERLFCEVTKDEVLRAKRPSDCPLVPVPPHGRLIDADEFMRDECNNCDGACESIPCDCVNCHADCRCEFMRDILDAPTVIPAEGET